MSEKDVSSVADRIEGALERLILDGEILPGAKINENALAARFGISRAPVREACRLLQRSGLVDIVPNKGSFVRAHTLAEIVGLFDIRACLGRLAGQLAAVAISRDGLAEMTRLMGEMDRASRKADAERYIGLNIEFHAALFAATGNARLAAIDSQIGKELRIYRQHGLEFGGGLAVSNVEHQAIYSAIEGGRCEAAGVEFERHIQNGRDRFIRATTATGRLVFKADPPAKAASDKPAKR